MIRNYLLIIPYSMFRYLLKKSKIETAYGKATFSQTRKKSFNRTTIRINTPFGGRFSARQIVKNSTSDAYTRTNGQAMVELLTVSLISSGVLLDFRVPQQKSISLHDGKA